MKRAPGKHRLSKKDHRLAATFYPNDRYEPDDGYSGHDVAADVFPMDRQSDIRFIRELFGDRVRKELKERGYDLSTMRFQIDRTPEAIESYERRCIRPTKTKSVF